MLWISLLCVAILSFIYLTAWFFGAGYGALKEFNLDLFGRSTTETLRIVLQLDQESGHRGLHSGSISRAGRTYCESEVIFLWNPISQTKNLGNSPEPMGVLNSTFKSSCMTRLYSQMIHNLSYFVMAEMFQLFFDARLSAPGHGSSPNAWHIPRASRGGAALP